MSIGGTALNSLFIFYDLQDIDTIGMMSGYNRRKDIKKKKEKNCDISKTNQFKKKKEKEKVNFRHIRT